MCFDSDDVGKGVKYDAYNVHSFPMIGLDTLQDNHANECKEYKSVMYDDFEDSYVGLDSDFDEPSVKNHCVSHSTNENDEFECDLSALQVLEETLFDHPGSCVQDIDRGCEESVDFQFSYEEMISISL